MGTFILGHPVDTMNNVIAETCRDLVSSKSVKIIIESDTNVRMIIARMLNNYMTED